MRRRSRQDVVSRWLRAARRALGAIAVLVLAAVALAALLLPPAAEAESVGLAARRETVGDPAAPPPGPRDGGLVPAALAALGSGLWAGPAPAPPPCGSAKFTGVVNLNSATERELDLLPGIGPAKAQRIVAWRARHGRFRRIKDLRRVKGFGRKTVLKLFPHLTLDGPTTAVAPD